MSDLAFPINPVLGQTYIAPGGKVWRWDGEGWVCLVDSGSQIYYNATPPVDIAKYPLWMNTDTGDLMVFYQDVDSDQWIKIGTTGGGSGGTGGGGGATILGDLTDVDVTGALDTYILEFDGTNWVAIANAGGGGSVQINDLTDVDTATSPPSLNDLFQWDNTNWVPYTLVTTNWDTAYTHSQSLHAPTDADNTAANETSHADVVVDGDFGVAGLMISNGAGVYSITTDNHVNWDTAYTHSQSAHAPTDADNTAANETSHADVVVDGDFSANGSMERTSLGTYITILHKRDATTAPLVTDDSGSGYSIGSRWVDVTNNKEYVAVDVSVGAAVWKETTGAGGGSALEIQDEGVSLTLGATKINFAGAGVTATEPVTDEILVTISSGSSIEVQDEGVSLTTAVTKFNFAGAGVTVTEPVTDEMLVTIPAGTAGSIDGLTDVDTTTTPPTTSDYLKWDGTNWAPAVVTGSSSSITFRQSFLLMGA